MHTVQVYIDDALSPQQLDELRNSLLSIPHIQYVGVHSRMPHDLLVEYEQQHVMPMDIINTLHRRGMHPDIIAC